MLLEELKALESLADNGPSQQMRLNRMMQGSKVADTRRPQNNIGMRKTSMDKNKRKLKIFSFFSGSGFLDLGFEKNGFDIELVNEYHSPFMTAYQYSRQRMGLRQPVFGYFNIDINDFLSTRSNELRQDITTARADDSLVGFIGGPPCPDYPEEKNIPKFQREALKNKGLSAKTSG